MLDLPEIGEPSPHAVLCWHHGSPRTRVYLTKSEYLQQLNHPDNRWRCPKCGMLAEFDDKNYEKQTERRA